MTNNIFLSIVFGIAALIAGLFRLIVLRYSIFISVNTGADISNIMYTKILISLTPIMLKEAQVKLLVVSPKR